VRIVTVALLALLAQETKTPELVPLKAGAAWTYTVNDQAVVRKAAGREKVGELECWVIETTIKERSQKEFVVLDKEGLKLVKSVFGQAEVKYDPPILRLKLPAKKGETWEWKGKQGATEGQASYSNEGEEEIVTPAGKYKAWKIASTMEGEGGASTQTEWYAPDVGLVRLDASLNVRGVLRKSTMELKSFEPGK